MPTSSQLNLSAVAAVVGTGWLLHVRPSCSMDQIPAMGQVSAFLLAVVVAVVPAVSLTGDQH